MWMKKKKISCNSLAFVIIAVFACVFLISSCNFSCSAPNAFAQEVTKSKHSSDNIIATDSITDTENLLGDSVNRVSDAIDQTKKQTGVSVRLLYIYLHLETLMTLLNGQANYLQVQILLLILCY